MLVYSTRMQVSHRAPGEHKNLGVWEVYTIPREGEVLEVEGVPFTVHSVSWAIVGGRLAAHVLVRF